MVEGHLRGFALLSVVLILIYAQSAQSGEVLPYFGGESREYDARVEYNQAFEAALPSHQREAMSAWQQSQRSLAINIDRTLGSIRSVHNPNGYLTAASPGDASDIALSFAHANRIALGLTDGDINGLQLQDRSVSRTTGATHLYYQQSHAGIEVYNAQLQAHVNRDGRLLYLSNSAIGDAQAAAGSSTPVLSPTAAIGHFLTHLGIPLESEPEPVGGDGEIHRFRLTDVARGLVDARLVWLPVRQGELRLAWNLNLRLAHGANWFDANVDAQDGRVWTRRDWVDAADYRAFPQPIESPIHSANPPPADGRELVSDPEDAVASPMGWHQDSTTSYTITRGNNVHAVDDASSGNPSPDCGAGLVCDFEFPIDFATEDPRDYIDASVANLFY